MTERQLSLEITTDDLAVFENVSDVVSRALVLSDPRPAFKHGIRLQREGVIRAIALAKLLHEIKKHWEEFQRAGLDDDFETTASVEIGLGVPTIRKYVRSWGAIFENPDIPISARKRMMTFGIKTLFLLTGAAREQSFTPEQWEEVSKLNRLEDVRRFVREVRGGVSSSVNAVYLSINEEGTLMCRRGTEGFWEPFGFLSKQKMEENDTAASAIRRIIRTAGIREIGEWD